MNAVDLTQDNDEAPLPVGSREISLDERRRKRTERRSGLTNRLSAPREGILHSRDPYRTQPNNITASNQVISLSSSEEEEQPTENRLATHGQSRHSTVGSRPVDSIKDRQRATQQDVISINSDSDDSDDTHGVHHANTVKSLSPRQKNSTKPTASTSKTLSGDADEKTALQTPETTKYQVPHATSVGTGEITSRSTVRQYHTSTQPLVHRLTAREMFANLSSATSRKRKEVMQTETDTPRDVKRQRVSSPRPTPSSHITAPLPSDLRRTVHHSSPEVAKTSRTPTLQGGYKLETMNPATVSRDHASSLGRLPKHDEVTSERLLSKSFPGSRSTPTASVEIHRGLTAYMKSRNSSPMVPHLPQNEPRGTDAVSEAGIAPPKSVLSTSKNNEGAQEAETRGSVRRGTFKQPKVNKTEGKPAVKPDLVGSESVIDIIDDSDAQDDSEIVLEEMPIMNDAERSQVQDATHFSAKHCGSRRDRASLDKPKVKSAVSVDVESCKTTTSHATAGGRDGTSTTKNQQSHSTVAKPVSTRSPLQERKRRRHESPGGAEVATEIGRPHDEVGPWELSHLPEITSSSKQSTPTRELATSPPARSPPATRSKVHKVGGLSTPRTHSETSSDRPTANQVSVQSTPQDDDDLKEAASSSAWQSDAPDQSIQALTVATEELNFRTLAGVKSALQTFLIEYRSDSRYTAVKSLAKAHALAKSSKRAGSEPCAALADWSLTKSNGYLGIKHETNPFRNLKPLQRSIRRGEYVDGLSQISIEQPSGKGLRTVMHIGAPTSTWQDEEEEVPPYTHCTILPQNMMASNKRQLFHFPYFGEVDDPVGELNFEKLNEAFDLDIGDRKHRLLRGEQARALASYAESFLYTIGCDESAVLYYLLKPDPERDSIFAGRAISCQEYFPQESARWIRVFSLLAEPSKETLTKASLACTAFIDLTGFSLWHLVRKSKLAALPTDREVKSPVSELGSLACRICHRHQCPYHADIQETSDLDSDIECHSDSGKESDVEGYEATEDELDIDWPLNINYMRNFNIHQQATPGSKSSDHRVLPKKKGVYQQLLKEAVEKIYGERPRFFPCHHPGLPCAQAKCKCFRDGVFCEKACGCSSQCERRFRGCRCTSRHGRGLCYQDQRCDCFRLDRECDADLCGTCGADVVLDPENRYNDRLSKNTCHNVPVQLAIPARTLLGKSPVQGFGLYAGERIKKHTFIGEYRGEIAGAGEKHRRGTIYEIRKQSYLFILNKNQEIDSYYAGNKTRYINHAANEGVNGTCNVKVSIVFCNMTPRIAMYANRDIAMGEELFFDYGKSYTKALVSAANEASGVKGSKKKQPIVKNQAILQDLVEPEFLEDQTKSTSSKTVKPGVKQQDKSVGRPLAEKSAKGKLANRKSGPQTRSTGTAAIKSVGPKARKGGSSREEQVPHDEDIEMTDDLDDETSHSEEDVHKQSRDSNANRPAVRIGRAESGPSKPGRGVIEYKRSTHRSSREQPEVEEVEEEYQPAESDTEGSEESEDEQPISPQARRKRRERRHIF